MEKPLFPLKRKGRLFLRLSQPFLQGIMTFRNERGFTQGRILPGAVVPSRQAFSAALTNPPSLIVENAENVGVHYTRTLRGCVGSS